MSQNNKDNYHPEEDFVHRGYLRNGEDSLRAIAEGIYEVLKSIKPPSDAFREPMAGDPPRD